MLVEVKQIPSCLCQVVGICVSLGSLLPPPQHLAYHVIKHSTFLYSLVSHKTLWLHSCCWGECACLKMSPARNVPSDTKQTPNAIVVPFEWAPAGPWSKQGTEGQRGPAANILLRSGIYRRAELKPPVFVLAFGNSVNGTSGKWGGSPSLSHLLGWLSPDHRSLR